MTGDTRAAAAAAAISEAELGAFCDGELDGPAAARVEAALAADPALRAEMARLLRERAALSALALPAARDGAPEEEAPDPALEALAARLQRRIVARRRRRAAGFAAGLAAALSAFAMAGWFAHDAALPRAALPASDAPGFVEEAAGAHAGQPDPAAAPGALSPAAAAALRERLAARLDHPVRIPRLDDLGFALIGGGTLGGAGGDSARLIYRNARGDRVSIVFGRHPAPPDDALRLARLGDVYASWWRAGPLVWAVLEAGPAADVSVVATRVAEFSRRDASP